MSFIGTSTVSFISLKRDTVTGKRLVASSLKPAGVDSELINMSPRFEEMIPSWEQGPEHYYGSDQSSFFSVYRELTRAKMYELSGDAATKTVSKAQPREDVYAADEVEARFHDLFELEGLPDPVHERDEDLEDPRGRPRQFFCGDSGGGTALSNRFGRHAALEAEDEEHKFMHKSPKRHPLKRRIDGLHLPRIRVSDAMDAPPLSARSLFLSECVDKDLQPRAGFLLRKMRSTEINMAQLGIGDRLANAFACCVGKLPNLLHLNISFNYLSNKTMAAILNELIHVPQLISLDISGNEIEQASARALGSLFASPRCKIEELETAQASLSDGDIATFLEHALLNERICLARWNLANNNIGHGAIELADGRTGLAEWIASPHCTCRRLDISWNVIRGEPAIKLGRALSTNKCVTHLNLAFNSLAEEGVVFGNSLLKNKVLKILDLSNNGLGPKAAFAMSVALLCRESALELLVMDGNPVGVTGGQALLRVLTRMDHRAHLSLRDCSFHGGSIGERWVIKDEYNIDLSNPILYCLARDILQGSPDRPCPPIDSCYITTAGATTRVRTTMRFVPARARPATADAGRGYSEVQRLVDMAIAQLKAANRESLLPFFPRRDGDDVPFLLRRELDDLLLDLGLVVKAGDGSATHVLPDTLPLINHWSQLPDTGRLEIGEFAQILAALRAVAGKTQDDAGGRYVVFDEATGEDLAKSLPETGILRLCFAKAERTLGLDDDMALLGIVGYATSTGAVADVLHVADSAEDHLLVLQMALPSLVLGHDTAARIFPALVCELLDPVKAIAKLLPRMASPLHVQAFIRAMLPKSTNRSRLQRMMGQRFQLLIDMPAGHYTLRLEKKDEREVLVALLTADRMERHRVLARAKAIMDTDAFDEATYHYPYVDSSQHGNRTQFRNETLDGAAVEITDEFLDALKEPKGLLEFDFVKTTRPPAGAEPMTRAHFSQILSAAAISDDVDDRCLHLAIEGAKTPRDEYRRAKKKKAPPTNRSSASSASLRASRISKMGLGLSSAYVERTRVAITEDAEEKPPTPRAAHRSTRLVSRRGSLTGAPQRGSLSGITTLGATADDEQAALMEAQQRFASSLEAGTSRTSAAGGKKGSFRPRMQSINAVSNDVATSFVKWFKDEEGGGIETARSNQLTRRGRALGTTAPPQYGCGGPGRRAPSPLKITEEEEDRDPEEVSPNTKKRRQAARDGTMAARGAANPLDLISRSKGPRAGTPDAIDEEPASAPGSGTHTPKATTRTKSRERAGIATMGGGSDVFAAGQDGGRGRKQKRASKLKTIARMMITGANTAKNAADTELVIARLNEFHLLLAGCWFSAAQACTLLRRWELFDGDKLRNKDVLRLIRPQVELVIMLHSRIVDLYNIDEVFAMLSPAMRAETIFRLGTLNIWSPLKPEGPYSLNLALREDRQVVRMLVHLHEAENAIWRNPTLRWKLDIAKVEGWALPTTWLNPEGIPRSGHVAFTYDPPHEDWPCRLVLSALTLAGVDRDDDDLFSELPQDGPLEAMLKASLEESKIKWEYDGITLPETVLRKPRDLPGERATILQGGARRGGDAA